LESKLLGLSRVNKLKFFVLFLPPTSHLSKQISRHGLKQLSSLN
jgi:hypothetical protein